MIFRVLRIFTLCLILMHPHVWSNPSFFDNDSAVVAILAEHGFENIYVQNRAANAMAIYYENRLYRNELFASGVVAALVHELLKETPRVILVPCRRALPICELDLDMQVYHALLPAGKEPAPDTPLVRVNAVSESTPFWPKNLQRPAIGKVDIILYPSFSVHLGNYDDRFKLFFALMPVVSTSLWKGAAFYVEAAIPIYNDVNYHYFRFKDYPQLSKAAVSQIMRLPFDVVASLSAGAFNPNRWGIAGEVNKLFFNRHLSVGYNFEHTGFLLYYDGLWNYSKMDMTTSKLYTWYYSDFLDCQFGVSYNRYVMRDSGPMFEFSRNFRDTSVGFFFGATEVDKFGGFMINFPFSPQKQPTPRIVRVTLPRYYEYSYRATNVVYTQHAPIQTGISVYTGTKLPYLYQNLTPNFVKNNIRVYKEAFDYITLTTERRDEDENLLHKLKEKK
ncbi:YjbH domain-containing protein [candidate division KSB1 bacterium]|nr:YjbH domain-containing protein [candidate division KSB1 bacterium]